MTETYCTYPSGNHSDDRVEVFHGSTTPTKLCGFHSTWDLNVVLKAIRSTAALRELYDDWEAEGGPSPSVRDGARVVAAALKVDPVDDHDLLDAVYQVSCSGADLSEIAAAHVAAIKRRDSGRVAEAEQACEWFAACTRPAAGTVAHPILGEVPTCTECATKLDLTFTTDTDTTA